MAPMGSALAPITRVALAECDNAKPMTTISMPDSPAASTSLPTTPTLRRRMACWMYEGVLLFGVVFIADYLFSALTQTRSGLQNRHEQQAFLFVVLGIYFGWFWSRGQTLAMKTWHIRIVGADGQRVSQGRAVWRYVLSWIWFLPPLAGSALWSLTGAQVLALGFAWVALWAALARAQPQRQFWHDVWAGTRLVVDTRLAR